MLDWDGLSVQEKVLVDGKYDSSHNPKQIAMKINMELWNTYKYQNDAKIEK